VETVIDVPDETSSLVEARAAALGMSPSEFYTRDARLLLERTAVDSVQARVDVVVEYVGTADESHHAAVAAGRRVLVPGAGEDW